jgi:hypothetical protein
MDVNIAQKKKKSFIHNECITKKTYTLKPIILRYYLVLCEKKINLNIQVLLKIGPKKIHSTLE